MKTLPIILALGMPAFAQSTDAVTTVGPITQAGATEPWVDLGEAKKITVSAQTSDASCKYRLDKWDGSKRDFVPDTAEKACPATPETVTLSAQMVRVYVTQLAAGPVTFTLTKAEK
jgi:hypothetical protein